MTATTEKKPPAHAAPRPKGIAALKPHTTTLMVVGGVLTLLGSFLPWATFVLNKGPYPAQATLQNFTAPLASSTPGYADQSALLGHDQAKAAAVLDAAGWLPGPDGVRVKDGRPLRIELTWFNNAGSNKPTLELLQQQVRRVGIDLQLRERPISDASVIQQSGEFDALWGNLTRADPDILRSSYSSKGANTYRFPASPLDDLLAEQAAQSDEDQRSATVAKILTNLTENYLTIPVVELTTTLGVAANVHGLKYDASSRIQLYDTWKSQA